MNILPQSSWLAAYLYYGEPWETFLCNAVLPFVQQIKQQQLATQFFFIRYWEKGPHIRLRFKGNTSELKKYVKPALIKHLTDYFQVYPSSRTEPTWLHTIPEPRRWLPNHSIQFVEYEPETERYGGEQGLLIAENQFQASSEAVLSILHERGNWDYSRALGAAIQLHLGFAFAAGMDLAETRFFFSRVFENWLPRAYFPHQPGVSPEELQARKNTVVQAFQRTYQLQKPVLLPLFRTIWMALESQKEFEQAWFNQWLQQIKSTDQQLRAVQANGDLMPPVQNPIHPQSLFSLEQQQRWAIYDSYVHMTNNRLGILNHDEGFLGYLIKQVLEEYEC